MPVLEFRTGILICAEAKEVEARKRMKGQNQLNTKSQAWVCRNSKDLLCTPLIRK
jgi:hypothetical protein